MNTGAHSSSPPLPPCWLEEERQAGTLDSSGSFTIEPSAAKRMASLSPLELCDVPLLLLAGAVEGKSRFFRVHPDLNPRLSWEGEPGPSAALARSLLEARGVDARFAADHVELPPFFDDYLGPLSWRCQHAPLHLIWGDQVGGAYGAESRLLVTPSRRSRLTLVDRGIDFAMPVGFQGFDVVAWVAPLPGAPWPRCLLWGEPLRRRLETIAEALSAR